MLTILTIFIAVTGAGFAFWFYNRKQISSLTETIDDKTAIINSFREHLTTPTTEKNVNDLHISTQDNRPTIDSRTEKKKKYNNKQKKTPIISETKQSKQNSEKKNRPKPRKPKVQQ